MSNFNTLIKNIQLLSHSITNCINERLAFKVKLPLKISLTYKQGLSFPY